MPNTAIILQQITQDAFTNAEAILIDLVRQSYPTLDLRRGTVLRDWLIRPAASVYALNEARLTEVKNLISVNTILNNPNATSADIDAVLANYSVVRQAGTTAAGLLLIRVTDSRTYVLGAFTSFATANGLVYATDQSFTISPAPAAGSGELQLYTASDNTYYYFVVPVTAQAVGSAYNVSQGTVFTPSATIFSFISAEAYTVFAGGTDPETPQAAVARLPAAISYRALESRLSIEGKLRDAFPSIQAISVQGFGDSAQLRDKHNPLGWAVGSRVDVYTRTFQAPNVVTLLKTGQRTGPNSYTFAISKDDAPGFYAIRAVAEPESVLDPAFTQGGIQILGSYAFVESRSAGAIQPTFHDISPDNLVVESAYTQWQTSQLVITGVPFADATHAFRVELYTAPDLAAIQAFVDNDQVRNMEADYLIRCPLICMVRLNVMAYYPVGQTLDIENLRLMLYNYVNGRSFVQRLSRSELAKIMMANGVSRLDMVSGMTLQGIVRKADGSIVVYQGDALDLTAQSDPTNLLTYSTTVFACELDGIFIQSAAE